MTAHVGVAGRRTWRHAGRGRTMTAGEITAIGGVAGTVVAAFLKGMPAVINAASKSRREAARRQREEEEEAAAQRAAADARREAEVFDMRQKLHAYSLREHACELKLTRALAWLAHLEAALRSAGIEFVPYNESGRADSDPVTRGHVAGDADPTPTPTQPRKKGKP